MTEKTRPSRQETLPYEVRLAARALGQNIRVARLRRRMEQDELAVACGTTRRTIWRIESGEPGVAIGTVFAVLWKLGLLGSTSALANPDQDEHGKILEAARLPQRARAAGETLGNDF